MDNFANSRSRSLYSVLNLYYAPTQQMTIMMMIMALIMKMMMTMMVVVMMMVMMKMSGITN